MDEDTWREIFENEMYERGIVDVWDFSVDENFQAQKGWLQYSLSCFARFCCSICGRKWASSKVHLLFYMKRVKSFGQVKMHIFRQKCNVCNCAEYEEPDFIVENIEVAMKCLVNRICRKYYCLPIEDFPKNFVKDGRQDGPHDRDNCEACSMGVCNYIKSQEHISQQQIFTCPENIYTSYNTALEQEQQSREDTVPPRIVSDIPHEPQHFEPSRHPRQLRQLPSLPPHEPNSREEVSPHLSMPQYENIPELECKCCCIIL